MRPRHLAICLALAFATLAHAPETRAQAAGETKAGTTDEAGRLYQQGNEAYKKGDLAAAEAAYLKAWALSKTFDIAANLGVVELQLKKYREAAELLSFSLRNAPPSSKPAQRDSTKQSLDDAKKHVGTVRLNVSVEGASITVDGQPLPAESIGPEIFVLPGKHTLEASHPDREPERATFDASAGAVSTVTLTLKPKAKIDAPPLPTGSASAAATAAPVTTATRSAVPVFVLGGAAVVALGVGIGLDVTAAGEDAKVKKTADAIRAAKASCVPDAANFDARCTSLESEARDAQILSRVGVGLLVSAGLLGAGAVLYTFLPGTDPIKLGAFVVPEAGRVSGAISIGGQF